MAELSSKHQANFEWIIPGFSCQSLILTHIYPAPSSATIPTIQNPHPTPTPTTNPPQTVRKTPTNLPKRTQPRQDAPPNPRTILALRRRPDLDAHVLDRQPLDLEQQPVAEAPRQRRAAGEHDVGEQGLAQVEVGAADGVDDHVVQPRVLEPDDLRVEEDLGGAETFRADLTHPMHRQPSPIPSLEPVEQTPSGE